MRLIYFFFFISFTQIAYCQGGVTPATRKGYAVCLMNAPFTDEYMLTSPYVFLPVISDNRECFSVLITTRQLYSILHSKEDLSQTAFRRTMDAVLGEGDTLRLNERSFYVLRSFKVDDTIIHKFDSVPLKQFVNTYFKPADARSHIYHNKVLPSSKMERDATIIKLCKSFIISEDEEESGDIMLYSRPCYAED